MIVEVLEGEKDVLFGNVAKKYIVCKIGKPCQFRPVPDSAINCEVLIDNTRFGHSFSKNGRNFLVIEQASVSLVLEKTV
jgi:hypothetical protein